jgi:hypothetical protein
VGLGGMGICYCREISTPSAMQRVDQPRGTDKHGTAASVAQEKSILAPGVQHRGRGTHSHPVKQSFLPTLLTP